MTQTLIHRRSSRPFGVFQPSPSWLRECAWCGHKVAEHGQNGCEHDYTITVGEAYLIGPCGCDAVKDEAPQHVSMSGKTLLVAALCALAFAIGGYLFIVEAFAL